MRCLRYFLTVLVCQIAIAKALTIETKIKSEAPNLYTLRLLRTFETYRWKCKPCLKIDSYPIERLYERYVTNLNCSCDVTHMKGCRCNNQCIPSEPCPHPPRTQPNKYFCYLSSIIGDALSTVNGTLPGTIASPAVSDVDQMAQQMQLRCWCNGFDDCLCGNPKFSLRKFCDLFYKSS